MSDEPTNDAASAKSFWPRADIDAAKSVHLSHPWNPSSDIQMTPLSAMAGLGRAVVTLARVPPGKESFVYHAHQCTEEWLYILSGTGKAEIDGEVHEVGPGDFLGFLAPSLAHHLVNDGSEDLVYLMGGERKEVDIATFPRQGRTMVFSQSGFFAIDDEDKRAMTFADYYVAAEPTDEKD